MAPAAAPSVPSDDVTRPPPPGAEAFRLEGRVGYAPGFLPGMRSPALVVRLAVHRAPGLAARIAACEAEIEQLVAGGAVPGVELTAQPGVPRLPLRVLHWVLRLQSEARWPLLDPGTLRAHPAGDSSLLLFVPTLPLAHPATRQALLWVLACFNAAAAGVPFARRDEDLARVRSQLALHVGSGSNMPRFLRAAHELGVPWDRVTAKIHSFGQGARRRWLDSSFTDQTGHLGTRVARDKMDCANVLRRAGLPAPVHTPVGDAEQAVAAAEDLGYPVVVKPANLDGGAGVAPDLRDAGEVRAAYADARALSPHVLVEKHYEGRDYRLTVFQGRLLWAIERHPAGVEGDGRRTVAELLDELNRDPRRGDSPLAALKTIDLDEAAVAMLQRQGLSADAVPAAGRFVRLRRASNVALGGMPVAVSDRVHPENAQLALRAAAALRLDLAGVDLLIPDIGRSWLESGALLCEVNAQPSLGQTTAAHLYPLLLRELVPGNGRIPIGVVVGDPGHPTELGAAVIERLAAQGLTAGWAGPAGAVLGTERLSTAALRPYEAGQVLLCDARTAAAIVFIDADEPLARGLAFAQHDVLLAASGDANERLVQTLALSCDGVVGSAAGPQPLQEAGGKRVEAVTPDGMADWLARQMMAAARRHERPSSGA